MDTWHRLGTRDELLARVPFAEKLDRHRIAVFHYGDSFRAIADGCNHRGGPLSDGRLRDEFVMCPWHGWEYSVITGRGPEGFDEEQVPVFAVEERPDGVYVRTHRSCRGSCSSTSRRICWSRTPSRPARLPACSASRPP